jgi:hypothetical protein
MDGHLFATLFKCLVRSVDYVEKITSLSLPTEAAQSTNTLDVDVIVELVVECFATFCDILFVALINGVTPAELYVLLTLFQRCLSRDVGDIKRPTFHSYCL